MPAGSVDALHRTPARRASLEPLVEATVLADFGIEGDHHGRAGSSRQVVVAQAEALETLDVAPGGIREQLCVRGLSSLAAGDVLEIGTARLEVVKPRVPCAVMDGVRPGLRAQMEGRGGWCARVVAGGRIAIGDAVTVGSVDDPGWLHDFRAAVAAYEAAPRAGTESSLLREELSHLIGRTARDGFGVEPVFPSADATLGQLYLIHDLATTALVEVARVHGEAAAEWVAGLAAHYLEHATACL